MRRCDARIASRSAGHRVHGCHRFEQQRERRVPRGVLEACDVHHEHPVRLRVVTANGREVSVTRLSEGGARERGDEIGCGGGGGGGDDVLPEGVLVDVSGAHDLHARAVAPGDGGELLDGDAVRLDVLLSLAAVIYQNLLIKPERMREMRRDSGPMRCGRSGGDGGRCGDDGGERAVVEGATMRGMGPGWRGRRGRRGRRGGGGYRGAMEGREGRLHHLHPPLHRSLGSRLRVLSTIASVVSPQ